MRIRHAVLMVLFVTLVACNGPTETQQASQQPEVPVGGDVGQRAPDFTLPAHGSEPVTLSSFRGTSNVVLYFYPKDNTPGCTVEACSFRDTNAVFEALDTKVLGVSVDDLNSHAKFVNDYNLNFTLLADPDFKVSKLYNVETWMTHQGVEYHFSERVTFVIDKQGVIRKIYPNVNVETHAAEVLAFIKTLQSG